MNNNFVALITGSSRGIGASIVKCLAENNFNVVLNYNNSEKEALEIQQMYPDNIKLFKADVSDSAQAKALVDFTYNEFKSIDLLVNNAGIDLVSLITDTTDEDFDLLMKTNLYSAFYCSREASRYMIKAKSGSIINISSIWGVTGAACEVAYSMSKAGLDGLTKSLAKELGPSGITVNSIAPGIINTKMNNNLSDEDLDTIKSLIPLEEIGSPDDIAQIVLNLFLSNYITGQVIQVNGGWNI